MGGLELFVGASTYPLSERCASMQKSYNGLPLPNGGESIQYADGKYQIPDHPIIPFIEGDGTGRDIWRASQRVFDAAVEKAYGGKRSVKWFEIYAGEKAYSKFQTWLPDDSVTAGIEFKQGTPEVKKLLDFLNNDMLKGGKKKIREDSGVGIKPISITGTKRLVRRAIQHALENGRKSLTLVHKGNIQKFTE